MHWKILSNKEALKNTDVPKEYLEWEYRWSMIQKQILYVEPDIIDLQNIDKYNAVTTWFSSLGYESFAGLSPDHKKATLIFWKRNKLNCKMLSSNKYSKIAHSIFVYGDCNSTADPSLKFIYASADLNALEIGVTHS